MEAKACVCIIEDDKVIREGLMAYLSLQDMFEEVQTFASMEEFLEHAGMVRADVILTDIGLPGMSGIEGMRLIREKFPDADIIMLTVFKDENRIFRSMCAGATGYLLKGTPFPEILEAIRIIRAGGSYMSPAIARKVIEYFNPPRAAKQEQLSAREKQIVQALVDGLSYKLVADRLGISIDTVRSHIKNIYLKLQVNSKAEVISRSLKGLI
jgi:DNA-binding NarL/FixJ family response regulator